MKLLTINGKYVRTPDGIVKAPTVEPQIYATKVESGGDECPDELGNGLYEYFTIPEATAEGQREPKVGDFLVYDFLVANASGNKQVLCEITRLDDRGDPYRYGVYMRAICFIPAAAESGSTGGGAGENKLALLVGTQDATNNPYEITASDLEGVTEIGEYAFYNKKGLISIDLSNITSIGNQAFVNCSALTSVDMPNVTELEGSVFSNCGALVSVNMPKVESIGNSCFHSGCTALRSLTIPSTCTSIGTNALKCGTTSKKCTFTFEGTTPPTIATSTFYANYINKIIVPKGCGETYKTATNWTTFADYIEEATE